MRDEIETWRHVDEEGIYEVSSNGRLRKVKNAKQGIVTPLINHKGYVLVRITINGKRIGCGIHRLVAKAFIPNPDNKPQVNHKNLNKMDNHFSNLEWVTGKENVIHSFYNDKNRKVSKGESHYLVKPFINLNTGERFIKLTDAAKAYGKCPQTISNYLNKKYINNDLNLEFL